MITYLFIINNILIIYQILFIRDMLILYMFAIFLYSIINHYAIHIY